MSTWTAPNVIDALKTQLAARANLATVNIFSAHPGDDLLAGVAEKAAVVIGSEPDSTLSVSGSQEPGRFGPTNDEEYAIHCFTFSIKPGATDTIAKSARDRVEALFAEVEGQLTTDQHVNNTCGYARIAGLDLRQGFGEGTRWARLEFGIAVTSIL